MTPLQFSHQGRLIAGVLHADPAHADGPQPDHSASGGASASSAVLICNPLGQEAVRVHRMQRVLCEQLLRGGMPSLRFDYFGTGESMGDDEDGDIEGWIGDLLQADRVLRQRTRCTRVIWLGTRLGATMAAMAAQRVTSALAAGVPGVACPDGLVLWEPVTNGANYLTSLGTDHEHALEMSFGPFLRRVKKRDRPQAMGFGLGARLRQQLSTLTFPALPPELKATVVAPAGAVAPKPALGTTLIKLTAFEHDFDWTAEDALNTALVPAAAVRLLKIEIEALR